MKLSRKDFNQIKDIKILDLQVCEFCHCLNILNLGWKPFGRFYCRLHEKEYLLCWELCYRVCLNIWGCQLYSQEKPVIKEAVKVNKTYDWGVCYHCGKELKGASKKGVIKNRNNSTFWGLKEKFIVCLVCLKKKFYGELEKGKRKMLNKYLKRGYE